MFILTKGLVARETEAKAEDLGRDLWVRTVIVQDNLAP